MTKPLLFSERIVESAYTGKEAEFFTNDSLPSAGTRYEFTPNGIGQWIYKDFLNNLSSTTSLSGSERFIVQKNGNPVSITFSNLFNGAPFYSISEINDLLDDKADVTDLDGYVQGVTGTGDIVVDNTDPQNPIITYSGSAGMGDVTGPVSSISGNVATFSGTTGKIIQDSGIVAANIVVDADLATVATTGAYADLTGKPTLGTAAAAATTDFATAAQGVLAGTAVQPARTITAGSGLTGGGDLSANRTVSLSSGSIASLALADTSLQPATIGVTVQGYDVDTAKVDVDRIWTKTQRSTITALTSATTITIDFSTVSGNVLSLTLAHNATLANPTNLGTGSTKFSIICQQDGTGGRTLAFGANWFPIGAATAPAAPTGINAKFRIDAESDGSGRIDFKLSSVGV
jgi:hypothetical protein